MHNPLIALEWLGLARDDMLVAGLLFFCLGPALGIAWGIYRRRARRYGLWHRQRSIDTLRVMSWREFEILTGEAFRQLGYGVAETGGGGADGGVDLLLRKCGARYVVQCKHYRRWKVGVGVVREAVGVAVHVRAKAVYVVGLVGFTDAAQEFARGKPVHLVDGAALLRLIEQGRRGRKTVDDPEKSLERAPASGPA